MNWHLDVKSIEEREEILNAVKRLGPWYQSFDLADWLKIEGVHDGDSVLACASAGWGSRRSETAAHPPRPAIEPRLTTGLEMLGWG
ncbi:unnamed protein product, partial [marine sediment metagenome]